MDQNPFLLWLQETMQRFATKSPKYFKIWQIFLGAVVGITGIPALLTAYNIPMPSAVTFLQNKYAGMIALGMFIMAKLSSQSKIVGVDECGKPLKSTNDKELPFTASQEMKKVEDKPVSVLTPDPTNPIADRNN
jgi:hypothetical protein